MDEQPQKIIILGFTFIGHETSITVEYEIKSYFKQKLSAIFFLF